MVRWVHRGKLELTGSFRSNHRSEVEDMAFEVRFEILI
jgi:hypothetical protein